MRAACRPRFARPGWWLALVLGGALGAGLLPAAALAGPGSISGTITRLSNGQPVGGAFVDLRDQFGAIVPDKTVQTEDSGAYTIPDVPAGTYIVHASSPEQGLAITFHPGTANPLAATLVTVGEDEAVVGIDVPLPVGGSLSGRVFIAGTNTGILDAVVSVFDRTTNVFYFEIPVQLANGNYASTGILHPDVDYAVRASKAGFGTLWYNGQINVSLSDPVNVVGGQNTPNVGFPLSDAARITGTITAGDTLAGLAGAEVVLYDSLQQGVVATTITLGDGTFAFDDLPPGEYKLRSRNAGYASRFFNGTLNGTSSFDAASVITLVPNVTVADQNIELPQGGDVTGTVFESDGTTAVPGALVEARDAGTNNVLEQAVANVAGQYTFESRLPPGNVRIRATAPGFAPTFYDEQFTFAAANDVPVTAGVPTANIDVNLLVGGGIKGQVRREADDTPIDGATVNVFDPDGTLIASTSTQPDGTYDTGRILPPGTYHVQAIFRGPESLVDTFHANPAGFDASYETLGLDRTTASLVTVLASADAENVDVELPTGGTISGTIRNKTTNAPLAHVRVFADRFDASNFSGEFSVLTDALGNYTIRGLRDGDWIVTTRPTGFQAAAYSGIAATPTGDSGSGKFIRIQSASTVANVNMNLTPGGGSISGRVTRSDDDQPVPAGTQIQARGPFPRTSFVTSTTTKGNGEYSLTGLPPGQYFVEVRGRQAANGFAIGWYPTGTHSRATGLPVTVVNNANTPGIDFAVVGFNGGESPRQVTGTVMNALTKRIPFAGIGAFDRDTGSTVRFVTANGDGSYTLNTLEPRQYYVGAEAETVYEQRFHDGNQLNGAANLLDVTADQVVNLTLPGTAGTISGQVIRSGSSTPIVGASVTALTWAQTFMGGATTTGDGTFVIRGLPADLYKIRVTVPGSVVGFHNGVLPASLTFTGGVFVVVNASTDTPNVNVALAAGGGAIAGVVQDANSDPVAGAGVAVRDAAGNLIRSVSTLANGSYEATGLPTGDYQVTVNAPTQELATQWYAGKPHQNAADLVHVTAPTTTGSVNFLLAFEQGKISGTIFEADDVTPIAGAAVVVFDSATGAFVRGAGLTGTLGQYEAAGLAPGNYVIQARAPNRVRQYFDDTVLLAEATVVPVTNGGDASGRDFSLDESGDVIGQIAYAGSQAGPVRVRLFGDPGLTDLKAEIVLGGTTFPRPFSFLSSGPETNGLPPGTYYLSAFIDSIPNGVQDVAEASVVHGSPLVVASVVDAGTVTLLNPDPAAILQFSLTNYSVIEGGTATIAVTRTGSIVGPVTVDYETSDGTAVAGTHYTPKTGTLTFPSGQSQTFQVVTLNDPDGTINVPRTVVLRLSNPTNAQLGDRDTAALEIKDNDLPGLFKFSAKSYGAADKAALVPIRVVRTGGVGAGASVKYSTGAGGTAVAGIDYVAIPPTPLTFANETFLEFSIELLGNFVPGDPPKTVQLVLSEPGGGATLGTPSSVFLTITNDDVGGGLKFTPGSMSVPESPLNPVTFNVERPAGPFTPADNVTVLVTAVDGTAKLGVDYDVPVPGLVTFGPNETSKEVQVPLLSNPLAVANRSFSLKLQGPTGGATLAKPNTATVTITKVGFWFSQVAYTGNEGPGNATITVMRTGTGDASVQVAALPGTASPGVDYQDPTPVTVSFTGNQKSKTFVVPILDNPLSQQNRSLLLQLTGAGVGEPDEASLTILDKEASELVLTQFSPPLSAAAGKPFTIPNAVRNLSGKPAVASTLQLVLSTNDVVDVGDTILANRAVPGLVAGATSTTSTKITIPAGQEPGVYKLIALVDFFGGVAEQDEGNNTVIHDLTVVANAAKTFPVTGSLSQFDCISPLRDGTRIVEGSLIFKGQTGEQLTGTLTLNYPLVPGLKTAGPLTGAILEASGHLTGGFQYTTTQGKTVISKGEAVLDGNGSGATLNPLLLTLTGFAPTSGETCQITAELQFRSPTRPAVLLRFHHDMTAGDLGEDGGEFVAMPTYPLVIDRYRALADIGPDTAPLPAPDQVVFVGPAGSGLEDPGATGTFAQLGPTVGQYQSPWVAAPPTAPGGQWSVNYEGTDFAFDVPDPVAALRRVGLDPTFTQTNGLLQQVEWGYRQPDDGGDLGGPPSFLRTLRLQLLDPCGVVLHDSQLLDPATTSRTLSPAVTLSRVAEVRFIYTDNRDDVFWVRYGSTTPGTCPKVVEFSAPSYNVQESTSSAIITVRRVGDLTDTVTVDFLTSDGTAVAGGPDPDYVDADVLGLTLGPNVAQVVRAIPIVNNGIPEDPETLVLSLQNATGAIVGPLGTALLTINDDEPRVRFTSTGFSGSEGTATATITVQRIGATGPVVSVSYATSDGSAIAGVDYLATSGVLTFTSGQTSKTFTVPILNDALAEGSQTVNLSLGTPIGGALGTPSAAVLTISDPDALATFAFAQSTFSVPEDGGSILVTVVRTGSTGGILTVDYQTGNGTGLEGTDYEEAAGTLTFNPGEISKTFSVTVLPNPGSGDNRTVQLSLSSPAPGSQLGTPSDATLWIVNVDP